MIGIATAWGTLLGATIAMVLIRRVNPQSFHWTMEVSWPAGQPAAAAALLALGAARGSRRARRCPTRRCARCGRIW
ncbi:MAG: hypothetical protein KF786_14265 [Burkholderiaceae bacterium]|nr:hypothetical protein [Burkholderiaceae bacterium]